MSWEQGYDAGNTGLLKAVETAKLIGAVQERERIIKLLEDLVFQINSVEHNPEEAEGAYRALALIKGENK